jgi:hypothetical protein
MANVRSSLPPGGVPDSLEDPLRTFCLGPDAFLVAPRPSAPGSAARPAAPWLLELHEPAGETVRVLIAEGGDE